MMRNEMVIAGSKTAVGAYYPDKLGMLFTSVIPL